MPLLDVEGLSIGFGSRAHPLPVVEDLSFSLERGEALALVGESGSGKSVTAQALMGLVGAPAAQVAARRLSFDGIDLLGLGRREWQALRGARMAMIFQEPMTSLNPSMTVGEQITEVLHAHGNTARRTARERACELLARVQIAAPERRLLEYPHRLSGGMRQRVMIAMALALAPALLVADEPTTALDVTVQAQILKLIDDLRREMNMALLLVTHDLGVVANHTERIAVLYAGEIVELASTRALFARPEHPYTIGLMAAIPRLDREAVRLAAIPGQVAAPGLRPDGCRFAPRCPFAEPACVADKPLLREVAPGHLVRCRRAPLEAADAPPRRPAGTAALSVSTAERLRVGPP
jgi:oligopeptide/dipeptide ABC transporter ATP-binding protein